MPVIGKAKFTDFAAFLEWHKTVTREQEQALWQKKVYAIQSECGTAFSNTFGQFSSACSWESNMALSRRNMTTINDYLELTGQSWDVRYLSGDGTLLVISYGQSDSKRNPNRFLIPDWQNFLEYTPFADYSGTPLAQLRQLVIGTGIAGNTSIIPQGEAAQLSVAGMQDAIGQKQAQLEELTARMQAVENGETDELRPIRERMEALKAEMEAIQRKKMDELTALKEGLAEKIAEMKKQVFMLESEIYSIRCFLGETVQFVRLRSGKNAPLEQPVVLYQKMRYMVEDLGKFKIMWPNETIGNSIEKALATSDALLDAFAPAEKCISLIRYSQSGKHIAAHKELCNCLDTYEILHGNQLAILIRNGENLYIGWTDDEKISLQEDFFLKPTDAKSEPLPERRPDESEWAFKNRMERYERDMDAQNKRNAQEGLSRYFLFSILNGISATENSILPLPEFANNLERSQHILFSMADGALVDERYGSFGDIIARCNATVKKGDMILTALSLRAEPSKNRYSQAWSNDRGRGEKNRTHDVYCKDCTIYPINMVEFDAVRKRMRYRKKNCSGDGWVYYEGRADRELAEGEELVEYYDEIQQHNFISLEKDRAWWRDDSTIPARANFEVFPSEYINLTFLNSCWLEYVLSNQKISWVVNGTAVNYAYALRYISKALEFVREREKPSGTTSLWQAETPF